MCNNQLLPYDNNMYKDFESTETFTYAGFLSMLKHDILNDSIGYIAYLIDTQGYINITPLYITDFLEHLDILSTRKYLKVVWRYKKIF